MSKEVQDKTYRPSKKPKSTRRLPRSTRVQDKIRSGQCDTPPVILKRETKMAEEQGIARDATSINAMMRLMLEDR